MNAFAEFMPPFRSVKVTSHANGQPCTLRLRGICNGDPATTVFAHVRDRHKGAAQKASDSSGVFACYACHDYLDVGFVKKLIPDEELLRAIIRGMQETWEVLIRDNVVGFPHDKPKPRAERVTPPRKPKELRTKVGGGPPLQGGSTWLSGRKLESRNDLRKEKP